MACDDDSCCTGYLYRSLTTFFCRNHCWPAAVESLTTPACLPTRQQPLHSTPVKFTTHQMLPEVRSRQPYSWPSQPVTGAHKSTAERHLHASCHHLFIRICRGLVTTSVTKGRTLHNTFVYINTAPPNMYKPAPPTVIQHTSSWWTD